MADELNTISGILNRNRDKLLKRANVVATGIGYKETGGERTPALSIVCSVEKKIDTDQLSAQDLVPAAVEGIPKPQQKYRQYWRVFRLSLKSLDLLRHNEA